MSKADKLEYEKRIRAVMEWIIQDFPYCDIVTSCKQKWNIEDRQAKRYIKEARKRWGNQEDEELEQKLNQKILGLKKLKNSLKAEYHGTPKGIRAILAVDREIITLEKMRPAKRVEMSGPEGGPIPQEQKIVYVKESNVDYPKLSNAVLEEIVKAKKQDDSN